MINKIVGRNQVATPTDQMGTPPDIGKTQMGTPPEPVKSSAQTQSDASVALSLQQSALEKAGDQRVQASLLQAELLRKLANPPEPEGESFLTTDPERLMNSIKDRNLQESGPGDETSDSQMGEILSRGAIKEAVDGFLATDPERLMNSIKDKNLQESGPGDERAIKEAVDAFLPTDSERLMNSFKDTTIGGPHITKAFDPQPEPPLMLDLENKLK